MFPLEMEKRVYDAIESANIVKNYVNIARSEVVHKLEDITIKAPLVLKVLSKDALHKSDVNGVKIVMYPESIKPAFDDIIKEAKKHKLRLNGIMVQEFIKGIETIVGIKKDPVFGHMILFGLGGIFTEVIADTSTRKCPIRFSDAEEMINELKSSKVFYGFRGIKTNVRELKKSLVKISKLPTKYPEISELDINPLMLTDKKAFAVDVRIISSESS